MKQLTLATIYLILLMTAGCSDLGQMSKALENQAPKADVDQVHITGLDFDGIDLAFDLKVDNPNPVGINLQGLDYDLLLMNKSFIKGTQNTGMQIQANNSNQVQLPIRLGFEQLKNTYEQLKNQDEADYVLNTQLGIDIPVLGVIKVPVSHQGRFPIPKVPEIEVRDIALNKMSMSGGEIMVDVGVKNPNNFNLLLKQMDYDLRINGKQVGRGNLSQQVNIDSKGEGAIRIPVSMDFMELGLGLYSAITSGKKLDYDLSGGISANSSNKLIGDIRLPLDNKGSIPLSK